MNLNQETWYAIGGVIATLVIQIAHARGLRLPVVEWIFDWMVRPGTRKQAAPNVLIKAPPGTALSPEIVPMSDGSWVLQWTERR
jgi:hypothetical protein